MSAALAIAGIAVTPLVVAILWIIAGDAIEAKRERECGREWCTSLRDPRCGGKNCTVHCHLYCTPQCSTIQRTATPQPLRIVR